MLLKFKFSSALQDNFKGVLLPTYYELFSVGISVESDYIDHINKHYL